VLSEKTEALLRNIVSQLELGVEERTVKLADTALNLTEKIMNWKK